MKQIYLKSIFLSLLMLVMGNVGALAAEDVTWVKTDPANLATGDVVAIVDLTTSKAMANNGGTTNAPAGTSVTLNADKSGIASTVANTIQWTIARTSEGYYQFYVTEEKWLYSNNTNDGVRVGSSKQYMNYTIKSGYLYQIANNRYIGYSSGTSDWRCYASINSNIINNVIAFFKKVTTVSDKTLTGLMISGYPTEFYVGDEFTFGEEGTVTAVYDDNSTKVVTQNCQFSEPDMSTAGTKTVTITYTEGEIEVNETYNITVNDRTLEFIELSGDYKTEFNLGDEFVFGGTVTATYDNESTKDVTDKCEFSEPDMSTAGTKTVTVTYTEGEMEAEATYTITVSEVPVTSITLNTTEATIFVGKTKTLTATIAPGNATNKNVTWSSSNESVATVADGVVTAVSTGTATITATAEGGSDVTATCAVTVEELTGDAYTLVTSASDINAGDKVIIVNAEASKAMSTTQNSNNRGATDVYFDDDGKAIVPSSTDIQVFTLEGSANGWYFSTGEGYIYAASSSGNQLKTETDKDDNAKASISISGNDATVQFQGSNTRNLLRYNSTSDIFSCYGSGQQAIQLYKKEVTTTNAYTLVAGEEETPFEGLTLTQELPAQTIFYIKDSNGNEYHSTDAQSVMTIKAENHENLPTSAEGKGFYLEKANTWVFTLTEGDEGALTVTVSPQTEGATKYMMTSYVLGVSEDVFDENNQLTKEMTTDPFYITRSDDYGETNLFAAEFNDNDGPKPIWKFSEDNPTVGFIAGGGIWGAYKVAEAGMYTFTLDLENKTVKAEQVKNELYTLVTSVDNLSAGDKVIILNKDAKKAMGAQNNNNRAATAVEFDESERAIVSPGSSIQVFTLEGDSEGWYFNTGSGYIYASSSSSNQLRTKNAKDNNAKATIEISSVGDATIEFQGSYSHNIVMYNTGNDIFSCYLSGQDPVQIYKKVNENDVNLTIKSVGYATLYYSDRALKVPAGVTAKTYKVVDGKLTESKTYEAGSVIPQEEAVVLKGAAGNYTFFASSTTDTPDADNQLKGSDEEEETTGGKYYYALQAKAADGSGGPGMYWMVDGGGTFMNGAHKAYMALPEMFDDPQEVGGARSFYLFEDATGINNAQADREAAKVQRFNMSGQRVGNNYKGIVIVNGKKIVRK